VVARGGAQAGGGGEGRRAAARRKGRGRSAWAHRPEGGCSRPDGGAKPERHREEGEGSEAAQAGGGGEGRRPAEGPANGLVTGAGAGGWRLGAWAAGSLGGWALVGGK
jgi:hypothetical protein